MMANGWFPPKERDWSIHNSEDFHFIISVFYHVKNSKFIIPKVLFLGKGFCHFFISSLKDNRPEKLMVTFRSGMSIFDTAATSMYTHT